MKATDDSKIAETIPWNSTKVYRLIDSQRRVVHLNWSFTRHPAAMQGVMS